MSGFTWAVIVVLVWMISEWVTFWLFGWPADWDHLSTVIAGCVIAVLTFPRHSKEQ